MDTSSANARGRKTILLLSGTSEGPLLARALVEAGFHVRATVTRQEACAHLFGTLGDNIDVEARGFTEESLAQFLLAKEADLVLDATHPFAVRITLIAHKVCARLHVPYVRYERPDWPAPPGTHLVDSFAQAAARLPDLGHRVMLTIGAKQLKHFTHLHDRLTLFARILPSPISLAQALKEGFTREKVLCLRPPFSLEFNKALFREYQVDVLVTKASGYEGGVVEKVTAAQDLGMQVMMIRRPVLADLASVSSLEDAVALCRRLTFV
ncbi:MAG TPA: precorrin-6A reductase [Gemmataceae bacterium]|nr:precorrin-6A reductase [Gemmataceae bacterium]